MANLAESESTKFERQIERIHQLVESEGAEVTWNDKIPDPDNPAQSRQIDITIRRDGHATLVECRFHKDRQDVQWIEELIGRKVSLRADGVIAVSASGFTSGAIRKSQQFGIILRTIYNLSETEIRNWGKATTVKAVFYEFTDTVITIWLPKSAKDSNKTFTNEDGTPVQWREIFQIAMGDFDGNRDLDNHKLRMEMDVSSSIIACGVKPLAMRMDSTIARIQKDIPLAAVIAYASPEEDSNQYAHVAKYDLGEFEILQSRLDDEGDEVAVVADTSQLEVPTNCLFHNIWMDFGRGVTTKWFKVIGIHRVMLDQVPMQLRLHFA